MGTPLRGVVARGRDRRGIAGVRARRPGPGRNGALGRSRRPCAPRRRFGPVAIVRVGGRAPRPGCALYPGRRGHRSHGLTVGRRGPVRIPEMATDGPDPTPIALDDLEGVEKILVVCAHPDDVDFGVAGSVAVWVKAGVDVAYCIVTDGDAGGSDRSISRAALAGL